MYEVASVLNLGNVQLLEIGDFIQLQQKIQYKEIEEHFIINSGVLN